MVAFILLTFPSKLSFVRSNAFIFSFSASCSAVAFWVPSLAIFRSSAIFACNAIFSTVKPFSFSCSAVKFASKLSLVESKLCISCFSDSYATCAFCVPSSAIERSSEIFSDNSALVVFSCVAFASKFSFAKSNSCIFTTDAFCSASALTVPSSAIERSSEIFSDNSALVVFSCVAFASKFSFSDKSV